MSTAPADGHYAVIGHPVAHSRSPFIHGEFARRLGQTIRYERLDCPPGALAETLARFRAEGGVGCNITVPHKFEAHALCRRLSERAVQAGAVNVLKPDGDGWWGDNSDGIGLVRDLEGHAACPLAGRRLLLIGAGGAAAGVLGPLLHAGCRELQVVNRSLERARALCDRHAALAADAGVRLGAGGLGDAAEAYDVVINATASSLAGGEVPVAARVLRPGTLAVDLMYDVAACPFLQWAEDHGATGRDGLGMLVEQAAEAYWLWRGVRPPTAPVLQALRAELRAAQAGASA